MKIIDENISYIPASLNPLSADVVFIKTENATWIYDTGSNEEAQSEINAIQGAKNIVLSHFHPDHTANTTKVSFDKLYLSRQTSKYIHGGTIIESSFKDNDGGIEICPIPSSHAKGCLCLIYKDYAFLGDATYCKEKDGSRVYNVQQLKAEISFLETLQCKYVCLSHDEKFVHERLMLIKMHKSIYAKRSGNEPYVVVDNFFR